ncbi:gamma carbonic anhydrase family protein [Chengkuizengella axinellae]|uniref:Gamma carbonic anhydrase family protein n=1 Tax=Chengkuizengella axinellae TaxID=3064388 RepID=A0ABT9J807_9BACL|nr:hypothetical protein [Chengkuizengella sp. 2205SS18-9]MDP5277125.1 hypothetical protein [Chengkuizengella sp. 2205SS18-9]
MLIKYNNNSPSIHPTASISPSAVIEGDVIIGPNSVVLAGAVLTSEGNTTLEIEGNAIIMENAVIRSTKRDPTKIAQYVLIGPSAHISGSIIEKGCFIATNATVLSGSKLGEGTMLGINGVVHIASECLPSTLIPIGYTAIGNPAKVYSPNEINLVHESVFEMGFTKTLFGFDSSMMSNGEATKVLCEKYINHLLKHKDDEVVST